MKPQQTIIMVSEFPDVSSRVKKMLNQNNFNAYETSKERLFKNRPPADLVLFCPMPDAETCDWAHGLYPGKIAVFVFGYGEKKYLPVHLQDQIHLVSMDQHLPEVREDIQRLTNRVRLYMDSKELSSEFVRN